MKVIFLDIDGVLCTRRSHLAYGKEGGVWHEWDPLGCDVIKRMLVHGIKIVVSSTWRKPAHEHHLVEQFGKYGFSESDLYLPDWKTPVTRDGRRGNEIQQWLNAHAEVTDYRIIDDDHDMLDSQSKKCVFTDPEDGLTSDNIKALYNWAGLLKS